MDTDHFFLTSGYENSEFRPESYDYIDSAYFGSVFALMSISDSFHTD